MLNVSDLRPYQKIAVDHLTKYKRCALWADMGMGKTVSTLTALNKLNYIDDVYPALIVAPLRVARDTWPDEPHRWAHLKHLKIVPIIGTADERKSALNVKSEIYSINLENIPWLVSLYGKKWPFKTIVMDEASRLAGFRVRQGTVRSKELYKVSWLNQDSRMWELTGGPAPGGLKSLHGPIHFLDQGDRLGRTFTAFQERWFQTGYDGFSITPLPHAQEEIQNSLSDICLSIRAEDWFDIKEPIKVPVYVDLPPVARKFYDQMEREMFISIENEGVEAFNAAAKRNKCMQIVDGCCYLTEKPTEWKEIHRAKIDALESIVEEVNGSPLLVSYHFKFDLIRLKKAFPSGVDLADKEGMNKFKKGNAILGFAHPASLGHGINGLEIPCHRLVYFSHNDNLDNHKQILGRVGPVRQIQSGFDRPVFQYDLIVRNTVEEWGVIPNLEGKNSIQNILMERMRRI